MAQHDYQINDQPGASFLADLNAALAAIVSNNAGASEPPQTYAHQLWADTTSGKLKMRNASNTAWIEIGTLGAANLGLNPALNFPLSIAQGGTGATTVGDARAALGLGTAATQNIEAMATTTMAGAINEARGTIAMHATDMDLWAQPNTIDGTGSAVTITAIANAPQAGAKRTLYPVAGTTITHGATFDVQGGADYTTLAGDALVFEAVTTSTYKVRVIKRDGTAVVGNPAIVQVVEGMPYTEYSSMKAVIPADDTIPQNTEGVELVTVTITPTNATNRLLVEASIPQITSSAITSITAALFRDNIANALAASRVTVENASYAKQLTVRHEMAAGTTSATTFKLRIGSKNNNDIIYVNGNTTTRLLGGILAIRIRVTEIKA